jgi:uncharacterized damage-inducible protein DinB
VVERHQPEKNPVEKAPGKTEFLERIRQSRAKLDARLKSIDSSLMTRPGVSGDWSVKDILAHITWHEREMINVIQMQALVGSDLWNLPLDQRNAAIFTENKDKALKDVLQEFSAVFQAMMDAMETLTDDDLHDADRFAQMPSEWKPWELFASNTYEHYHDHLADLQAWLK